MNIKDALLTYGFNEDEVSIYIFCLKYGNSGATKIARGTLINRATIYSKIKEMIKKGYILENKRNKVKHFSCVMPENLIVMLENKKNNMAKVSEEIYSLAGSGLSRTNIEKYEGIESVIGMYQTILNSDTELKAFLGTTKFNSNISTYIDGMLYPKKVSNKIRSKTLVSCPEVNIDDLGLNKEKLREWRKNNSIVFAKDSIITLYGTNKIAMVNFGNTNPTGILIEDDSFFSTLENVFDFLRKLSE